MRRFNNDDAFWFKGKLIEWNHVAITHKGIPIKRRYQEGYLVILRPSAELNGVIGGKNWKKSTGRQK